MRANRVMVGVCGVVLIACGPTESRADDEPEPAPQTFPFSTKDATWDDVFAQYAELSGLKAVVNSKPKGTFTVAFAPPDRQLTLAEITDTINGALRATKHILIRRRLTFVIVSTEEKIDLELLPRLELAELSERGSTELVQVVLPARGVVLAAADDLMAALDMMLSPFGKIVIHKNVLIVADTAFNVARIRRTVAELDGPNPEAN